MRFEERLHSCDIEVRNELGILLGELVDTGSGFWWFDPEAGEEMLEAYELEEIAAELRRMNADELDRRNQADKGVQE